MSEVPNFYFFVMFFSATAFGGWIIESVYRSIVDRRMINAGFLYGPFVPIYGFAATLIYITNVLCYSLPDIVRFSIYLFLPTIVEYIGAYLLEKYLNIKLWDYSHHKYHLHGRICLEFSIAWFLLVLLDVYIIQPFLVYHIAHIGIGIKKSISLILVLYFSVDLFYSVELYWRFAKIIFTLKNVLKVNDGKLPVNVFKDNPILLKIKDIFRPITAFPELMNYMHNEIYPFVENIIAKTFKLPKLKKKEPVDVDYTENKEFMDMIQDILDNKEFQKLKNYHHHEHSIYEHSLLVAWMSFRIGTQLNSNIKINIRDLVRGALLHDFFLYDWRTEGPASGKIHAFEHPKEAYKNSARYFSPITSIQKDIILKHMWPLNIFFPRYLETVIVTVSDKIIASKEFITENKNKIMKTVD